MEAILGDRVKELINTFEKIPSGEVWDSQRNGCLTVLLTRMLYRIKELEDNYENIKLQSKGA